MKKKKKIEHKKRRSFRGRLHHSVLKNFSTKIVNLSRNLGLRLRNLRRKKTFSVVEKNMLSPKKDSGDALNREIYAEKIAKYIEQHHNENKNRGVIFAISGKWGSGKTRILDFIKDHLREYDFDVVDFDPWGYSQDTLSTKRGFLNTLGRYFKDKDKKGVDLSDLYSDSTELIVPPSLRIQIVVFLIGLLCIIVGVSAWEFSVTMQPKILSISFLVNLGENLKEILTLPLFSVTLISSTIFFLLQNYSIRKTTGKIDADDRFKSKFDEIIGDNKKVAILIDNLDRCTPDVVKHILDSVVTFLEHKGVSYIITGDHTVIENYVGSNLYLGTYFDPDGAENKRKTQQREIAEGRRFIKKLFDVYWKIPPPEPFRFKNFILGKIKENKIPKLTKESATELVDLLNTFLERNPREVERFLSSLNFNLSSIKLMIGSRNLSDENKISSSDSGKTQRKIELKGLKEVYGHPTLLAKVLLIQELFYPLYEELVKSPIDYLDHEKKARKGVTPITDVQKKEFFIEEVKDLPKYVELLQTEPKFTDDKTSRVLFDPADFFYLSGFTGLPSQKGPDPETFLQMMKTTQEVPVIVNELRSASEERRGDLFKLSWDSFPSAEGAEKNNLALNSVGAMLQIPSWRNNFQQVVESLEKMDLINTLSSPKEVATQIFKLSFGFGEQEDRFFTNDIWNSGQYPDLKWGVFNEIEKNMKPVLIEKFISIASSEIDTSLEKAVAHIEILSRKIGKNRKNLSNFKALLSKLTAAVFYKSPDDSRQEVFARLVGIDKLGLIKSVVFEKLLANMRGVNSLGEVKSILEDKDSLLSGYVGETYFQRLKKACIELLLEKTGQDWLDLADYLSTKAVNWEKNNQTKLADSILENLASTNAGEFESHKAILEKPYVRSLVDGGNYLLTKLTRLTFDDEVELEKRRQVVPFLHKEKWPEIPTLKSTARRNLTKASLSLEIGEGAKAALDSWQGQ